MVYSLEAALRLVPKHIDHIVLTGGEPFAQKDILGAIHLLEKKGYKVAVHTNGSYPELLGEVIYDLDYVVMDIKGTLDNYEDYDIARRVFRSMVLITDKGLPHEFRTTVVPGMSRSEPYRIAHLLSKLNAHVYYLQTYRPVHGESKDDYMQTSELERLAKRLPIKTRVR